MISLKSQREESSNYVGSFFAEQGWRALKDSATPLRVTLLTDPLAGHMWRINSTKKRSGTAFPAQIKFHCRSQLFQKQKPLQEDGHSSQVLVSQRAKEVWMFVIIKSQWRKTFIDNGTEKKHSSGDKEKAEARSGSGSMLCQGGKGKSQPQVHQPSDKDVNSSVKTFTEKVLQ